ncbi:outer membrane beta-barrel protein [Aliifodinibius sp. S!AR15-10]|uniref:porin family protein n=1 Tax=Aliifodinibius sp. S!AR15-10 TaxID=2950437 RepID=UPI00285C113D|nr:outer membrane beta-barrel protein [Aliifodinibius sp. S!AR15-10]MDR8390869.1 outer membrane beta-barrel protein [Aliifodinibius sp. S!AR15-10]
MKKLILLPFVCSLLAVPLITQGQSSSDGAAIKNTIGFGPRLGYYKASDAEDGSFYGGVQARIRLGPVLGIEGAVDYRSGQRYEFAGQSVETKFVPVTGSLMMFLPLNAQIAPYGLAGLGAYYTIYDYEGTFTNENENEFNFGYHLGFGVEFPIGSNAALNADYRYLFLNPDDNEQSLDDASFSGNVFTVGLMFYL